MVTTIPSAVRRVVKARLYPRTGFSLQITLIIGPGPCPAASAR